MITAWGSNESAFKSVQLNKTKNISMLNQDENKNIGPDSDKHLRNDIYIGSESYETPRRSIVNRNNSILDHDKTGNNEIDCNEPMTSRLHFSAESYATPRRSKRSCCDAYHSPPPPPLCESYTKSRHISRINSSIMIPSIGSSKDNAVNPLFKLLPRKKHCKMQSCLRFKPSQLNEQY